jgi:hypothetical protein
LSWWTIDGEDLNATGEVEIWGDFARRGVNEVLMKGCGKVETPYVCEDPDDCMWPSTPLTHLYEIAHQYKERQYREGTYGGESIVSRVVELFSDPLPAPKIYINDADVDEIEQLLQKAGVEVLRLCRETQARLQIEKSEGNLIKC